MAKKKKPAEYYFGKFLNTLREEDAEIKIFGNTYSSKNKNLTIKSLVQEICEFDSPNKIDSILRKGKLKPKNSRKGKASYKQQNVINELVFFFKKDVVESPTKVSNMASVSNDKPINLDIHKRDHKRSEFYMKREGFISYVYPNLADNITGHILKCLRDSSVEDIYGLLCHSISKSDQFNDITKKLYPKFSKSFDETGMNIKFEKIYRPSGLKEFTDKYELAILEAKKKSSNAIFQIMPQYKLGIGGYDFEENRGGYLNRSLDEQFSDQEKWFDGFRYKRMQNLQQELLGMNVEKWPKWTIEHLILIQLEYLFIESELIETVKDELLNNIGYTLYTSSNGDKIDMQQDFDDLASIAKSLITYRFSGGVKKAIRISENTILLGNYSRMPNDLIARGQESIFKVFFEILDALINHLVLQISEKIGLSDRMKSNIVGSILDEYLKARRERVENINI